MNDFPPTFTRPWTVQDPRYTVSILEEQPIGSIVETFTATDIDSKISAYTIQPESEYFEINNLTGKKTHHS